MQHPIQKLRGFWLLFFLTAGCMSTQGLFGFDSGVYGGISATDSWKEHFPEVADANIAGITSSCFSLGAFVGCLVTLFWLGDKLGRRWTIMTGMIINTVSVLLQVTAFSLPQMIVGRVINGFGIGITSSTAPAFQAECSPAHVRGRLVVLGSLTNTFGVWIAGWVNFGIIYASGDVTWRFPLALQYIFIIIPCMILPFVPESPRWLFFKGREEEGLLALSKFHNDEISSEVVQKESASMLEAIYSERENHLPFMDILRCKDSTQNLRRMLLGCFSMVFQQLSGVNGLGYYMPTLLEDIGLSGVASRGFTAGYNTMYMLSAFACLLIIDRAGRRPMLFGGSIGMTAAYLLAAFSILGFQKNPDIKTPLQKLTIASFFIYYFCYGITYAKLPWVILSELPSVSNRTAAAGAATATNWMGSFIVTQFTPPGIENLNTWGFYLLFACFCLSYLPLTYLFYPETMNRTLEDIDEIFLRSKSIFVFQDKVLTQKARPQYLIDREAERIAAMQNARMEQGKADSIHHVENSPKV
ncbi:hypothetical protein TRICI_004583 [Trichomonascus ciferrii]|uniref:Major facilitator superfamily (MFS) profile domain-containing protein n=1 Tax=Trichomonascus ciferrii TaxID=44093 RepID=A0A642V5J2_9ASCO|nr:hypothetical protein TRICI_004583 [Trichomonascus ciferrii]